MNDVATSNTIDMTASELEAELRKHKRFDAEHWSYCYLDGERFDARSLNLSASGAFLETDQDIPIGARLLVVFEQDGSDPIQLVGRVVRYQEEPAIGLGIQWVRVVLAGPVSQARQFLLDVLELPLGTDVVQFRTSAGRTFGEFLLPRSGGQTRPVTPRKPRVVTKAPTPPKSPNANRVGPLTQVFANPEVEIEVDTGIRVAFGDTVCEVKLVSLGPSRVRIESRVAPLDPETPFRMEVRVTGPSGAHKVKLSGRLHKALPPRADGGPPVLVIAIEHIDEDGHDGGFIAHLKRVACKRMTSPA